MANPVMMPDFKPLYQCIHIHECIGRKTQFIVQFDRDRQVSYVDYRICSQPVAVALTAHDYQAQANLMMSVPITLKAENLTPLQDLLHDIIGFFIVEHLVVATTTDFRSRAPVDLLWDSITVKLLAVLHSSLKEDASPDFFLKIKLSLILFMQTLEVCVSAPGMCRVVLTGKSHTGLFVFIKEFDGPVDCAI